MAIRLSNCSAQTLRIDLRGGESLSLAPGATSPALAEERLYDNMFLAQWEREGRLVRLPAKMSEVGAPPAAPASTQSKTKADESAKKSPAKKPPAKNSQGGNAT